MRDRRPAARPARRSRGRRGSGGRGRGAWRGRGADCGDDERRSCSIPADTAGARSVVEVVDDERDRRVQARHGAEETVDETWRRSRTRSRETGKSRRGGHDPAQRFEELGPEGVLASSGPEGHPRHALPRPLGQPGGEERRLSGPRRRRDEDESALDSVVERVEQARPAHGGARRARHQQVRRRDKPGAGCAP